MELVSWTAVERAGHVAALLDLKMPPHLVEDAAASGVELLPGLGDLEAECDCGAWDHCGHTAALRIRWRGCSTRICSPCC